jgi:hypothetical protein
VIVDVMQDGHEQQADWLAGVDEFPHMLVIDDPGRVPDVRGDDQCRRVAAQQRPGMRADDRVIVDIHDPRPRVGGAGDLMHVALRGQAGADVHELADAGRRHQVPHYPPQECPVGASARRRVRSHLQGEFDNCAVGSVVVLPAQMLIIYLAGNHTCGPERG